MRIREAAETLGVSERALRHYETQGLLAPMRDANGYRRYAPSDLRRAARIRDMIATGFSTREIRAMAPCLDDDGAGPCEGGLAGLEHKLAQIDRLLATLQAKRAAVEARIGAFAASLERQREKDANDDDQPQTADPVPDRLSGGGGRVPARPDPDADRARSRRAAGADHVLRRRL
jgi:DNA-binding transcriptional MerR regulator